MSRPLALLKVEMGIRKGFALHLTHSVFLLKIQHTLILKWHFLMRIAESVFYEMMYFK